jgi:hypothetical protein
MVFLKDGQILDELDLALFPGSAQEKEAHIFDWLKKQGW